MPDKLMTMVRSTMERHWGIYVAVVVRLALGVALIGVAPASLFPTVFQVLGIITVLAAIALAVVGRERLRAFIVWWSGRFSAAINRVWMLLGLAFGGFLVYGVL